MNSIMYYLFKAIFIVSISILLLEGCSSKKTMVVLLDNGKNHNKVLVSTNKGTSLLDKVGKSVELKDKEEAPSESKMMSKEEIEKRFSAVLAITPPKAVSYMLYFKPHSYELTSDSEEKIIEALDSIAKHAPCSVDIIGHTDTKGSNEINMKVSLKRAKYIEKIIRQKNIKILSLSVKGYGEEDLLVATPDETDEAKNRNVEIFIK